MSLLDVKQLVLRFGGLTAVDNVGFAQDEREILAVIGPNGAGKTSVFNAITGIYEPTSGDIRFAGRTLRRPITPSVWAACAIVGLLAALVLFLLSLNPNAFFRAAIKRNYDAVQPDQQFSYAAAARSAAAYWRGEVSVESPREGRFEVLSADSAVNLLSANSAEEAESLRSQLAILLQAPLTEETVLPQKVKSARARAKLLRNLRKVQSDAAARRALAWLSLPAGFALGFAGVFVVWQRGRRSPEVINCAGIARTFQNIRLFHNMTVLENVLVGSDRGLRSSIIWQALRPWWVRDEERAARAKATELLAFVGLAGKEQTLARNLPYGDQRRLEIARALATQPRLLLLDEPAAGMNPTESADLTGLIERIRSTDVSVLLIEHHMRLVMKISDRIVVLNYGKKIAEGSPQSIQANPEVVAAYLGAEEID